MKNSDSTSTASTSTTTTTCHIDTLPHTCDHCSKEDLLVLLRDAIPGWNHIQVLHVGYVNLSQKFIKSNFAFPSSLNDLRIRASGNHDDWSHHIVLPASLKKITFGLSEFQPTSKWPQMPATLETMVLNGYIQSLKNYRLPSSLTHLQIDSSKPSWQIDAPELSLKECPLPLTLKLLKLPLPNPSTIFPSIFGPLHSLY